MIQGNLHRVIGAETIGSSGHHSDFVVQTFDGSIGNLSLGLEPIEDQLLMRTEHPRHFLHGIQAAAERASRPDIQEGLGPKERAVAPKILEGFLVSIQARTVPSLA